MQTRSFSEEIFFQDDAASNNSGILLAWTSGKNELGSSLDGDGGSFQLSTKKYMFLIDALYFGGLRNEGGCSKLVECTAGDAVKGPLKG